MKTADLMDDFQDELQSCEIQFKNYGQRIAFYGPCRTLKCHNDNVLLRQLLSEAGKGHVLVVDGNGSLSCALMGDMIAKLGSDNNWVGIIINGAIRDTVALGGINFGVKAIGSNPRKSNKNGIGEIDVKVSFGNITVEAGSWAYCDEDGVVIANRKLHE